MSDEAQPEEATIEPLDEEMTNADDDEPEEVLDWQLYECSATAD